MIRIETDQSDNQLTLRVSGKLCGENVQALAECWSSARMHFVATGPPAAFCQSVDLSDVISIDQAGWRLLRLMHSDGVAVRGKRLATETIHDEMTCEQEKKS
jgi:ABC-type transporter Mla MlaB component